jgi:GTP pyrophosphokinase
MVATYEIPHTWEEPEGLQEMLANLREHRPDINLRRVRYAYYIAEEAHAGQTRDSGSPYITHPLAVSEILLELRMDEDTIVAGLLHDVIEDCASEMSEKIRLHFGDEVLALVEGVTKLKSTLPRDATPRQRATAEHHRAAESLRKMLLAMAKDIRVMVIKLADRLHNMRTLDSLPPEKRTRIATETLDVYAPLAARLGIWQVKWQLEDLAFKHLHPREFQEVTELIAKTRRQREEQITETILQLKDRLEERGFRDFEVMGRPKHLYSIFNKMTQHGFRFDDILDLIALRVIVANEADCYVALGVVHELWVPLPGLFSDYIGKPKPNGYQSLHTKVIGPHGDPLEVQIRTRQMHEVAEYGVAAHWSYKEGGHADRGSKALRERLFDWSSDNRTSSDFLRSVSTDLFSEQVFVFTPNGDVIDLPKESTPVDFAFRVHTDLGLIMVGSKVNGVLVPLNTTLKNGDVVEVVTRSNAQPSLDWLEFVKSAHARSKLRAYFRKRNKTENASRGREALEREFKALGLEPREYLNEDRLNALAREMADCETDQDVLAKVGAGLVGVHSIVNRLRGTNKAPVADQIHVSKVREGKVTLGGGIDNLMVKRARCCEPIPGDEVVGYVTRGRGMMIHRKICPNAMRLQSLDGERLVAVDWPADGSRYAVTLKIITVNRQGLLMDITTIFGEAKTNVVAAKIRTLPNHTAEIDVSIEVEDTRQLGQVMSKISNFSDVISILRVFGRTAR